MRLQQVAQRVEDLDRAVAFYRDVLGCPLLARFDPPGLAFFDLDGVRLLLERNAKPATLYLAVDEVSPAVERLRAAGVEVVAEPHVIFTDDDGLFGAPGLVEHHAFVRDSEGNTVGLIARRVPDADPSS